MATVKARDPRSLMRRGVLGSLLPLMCAMCVQADDLTLDPGQSHTVSGTETYDRVIVNGDLTVGAGATLKVGSICVATNISGTANLVLEENAKLTVLNTGANDCILGAAGGTANVEMRSGSTFLAASDVLMLYDPGSPAAFPHVNMVISNATLFATNQILFAQGRTGSATERLANVRLDDGAILRAKRVRKQTLQEVCILFNGGKIESFAWDGNQQFITSGSNNRSVLFLEATNANPVAISVNSSRSALFAFGSLGSIIEVCGDGDFATAGSATLNIAPGSKWDYSYPNLRFSNTGALRFSSTKTTVAFSEFLRNDKTSPAHDVVVADGAVLDIVGCTGTVKTVTLMGRATLTNSSSATSTLVVGIGNGDLGLDRKLPPRMNLVKKGTGRLSMHADDVASVQVDAGELKLMGRAEMGYPFYKFNVYGTGGTGASNARVYIAELNYLNGATDVTQGWLGLYYDPTGTGFYNSPTNMLDGDLATFFYDQRAQAYSSVSNIHVELQYALPHKVTGYRWNRPSGIHDSHSRWPTSWAVFGSEDNRNWRLLSQVDYLATSWSDSWREYACTNYPASSASIAGITLADGAQLSVDGADVALAAGVAGEGGAALSLAHGATLTLPADLEVSTLRVDAAQEGGTLVNFRPASRGALYLTNGDIHDIPVAVQNLQPGALYSWSVYVDGVLYPQRRLMVEDGVLKAYSGFVMTIR